MTLLDNFKAARRVSTPLVGITTPDPAATMAALTNGKVPALRWDIVRGIAALNEAGAQALAGISATPTDVNNPTEALILADKLPKESVLFFLNAHRYLGNEAVAQAVWNLRDTYKGNRRTLVLLAPSLDLPLELVQDVTLFDEPLPDAMTLSAIVNALHDAASLPAPDGTVSARAVDALRGLAAFPAEQVTAMSLTPAGLDVGNLWERKRKLIEQTPGLTVWRGGERFNDLGGLAQAKTFLRGILAGNDPPRAVMFVDEIEKALAGSSGSDTSGVSQEMHGQLLSWTQDTGALGQILIGPPGAGKSAMAKAVGNEAGIPTIAFDLSAMKGSLVGESTANLRRALRVCSAVADNAVLMLATCNSLGSLSPELKRRFQLPTMFFDLPDEEERALICAIYSARYQVSGDWPDTTGWTGAEIRTCAMLAQKLKLTLDESAQYVVPVSRSASEVIRRLQEQASGRFLSASYPGVYRLDRSEAATTKRVINAREE